MNHTQGKCACGHYHPAGTENIAREWVEVYNWATSMQYGPHVKWDLWVRLGKPDVAGRVR